MERFNPVLKILHIDDNPNEQLLTRYVLEKAGYKVVTAGSSEQALRILGAEAIDLVLSDHILRGTTGAEIAKRIKELHPNIPVVLFSGVVEPPPGSEEYTDVFVNKDAGPDQMLQVIATLLNKSV